MNSRIINLLCISLAMSWAAIPESLADPSQDVELAEGVKQFSDGELAQMLAPVALYPDSLLTHFLVASTYPLEIVEAERWLKENPSLEGAEALEAAQDKDWDPSVKALTPFPRVLNRMSQDLSWTQRVGDAFLQDEKRVLASIQTLRQQAKQAGNLDNMENLEVEHDDDNIVIVPKERSVIVVPYYDTRVIYGPWRWPRYRPVYWDWHWAHHHHHHAGLFYWHPRVFLSDLFFFSAFNWHRHHVVIIRHGYRNRYWHRRDIIRHRHAQRWEHRPVHRRGVAYRHETVRARYRDHRPSRAQSRAIRRQEARAQERVRVKPTREHQGNRQNRGQSKPAIETREQRIRSGLREQRVERRVNGSNERRNQGEVRGHREIRSRDAKPEWQLKNPRGKPLQVREPERVTPVRQPRESRPVPAPREIKRSSESPRPRIERPTQLRDKVHRSPPSRGESRGSRQREVRTRESGRR